MFVLKKKLIFLLLVFYTQNSWAFDFSASIEEIKMKIRPLVVKYIDEETAIKYFGEAPQTIKLPAIPKVDQDAKSTRAFAKSQRKEIVLEQEKKQKYDYAFLKELVSVVREEPIGSEKINSWMNVLAQGSSREGIYRALVLDDVYASYENFGGIPSDLLLEFTMKFLATYTNRQIQKSSLQSINFYSIKRIVLQRVLDIFDSFPQDNDDLFDWYAVMSSALAKNHPRLWENKLRMDVSRERHKNWAKSVPMQFLKGELIIKLHKVLNSFKS